MHFTQKLTYMGFGCLLTLAGYILAGMNNDSVAQSGVQDVTFGEITCRGLTVVDGEGKKRVMLRTKGHGGYVWARGNDGGWAELSTNEHGGRVIAHGKNGGSVLLSINKDGGVVYASGKDGGSVSLSNDKHGGYVFAKGKGGGSASLGVDEDGGAVWAHGKDDDSVQLNSESMAIFNKGGENVLQAGVGDTGGGVLKTKDKLGYRTGSLP